MLIVERYLAGNDATIKTDHSLPPLTYIRQDGLHIAPVTSCMRQCTSPEIEMHNAEARGTAQREPPKGMYLPDLLHHSRQIYQRSLPHRARSICLRHYPLPLSTEIPPICPNMLYSIYFVSRCQAVVHFSHRTLCI